MMAQLGGEGPRRIKKFYRQASVERTTDGYEIFLDGRAAKTPGRANLALPTEALAKAVAEEWNTPSDELEPAAMLLTQLSMSVIDLAGRDRQQWANEVLNYLRSDLLCYRADEPAELVERQASAWDPLLNWARESLGAPLRVTTGIIAVEQPSETIDLTARRLDTMNDWMLAGLAGATQVSGSAVIAMALAADAFPADDLFRAARLDEHFQAERWGTDAEAAAREARLKAAFMAVGRWLRLLEAEPGVQS